MSVAVFALLVGMAIEAAIPTKPVQIANATKFDLRVEGGRVTACTVTATSGYAQVDLYVCNAARSCGSRNVSDEQRETCITGKRDELARMLAQHSGAK